jgi:hypothetical protein
MVNPKQRGHLGIQGADMRIIFIWILNRSLRRKLDLHGSKLGTVVGSCDDGNVSSGKKKFLTS